LKNKRGEQMKNGALSPKFLQQSNIYMGRKISDRYSASIGNSNKRMKSKTEGCGCGGKNKHAAEKINKKW
jgi:hypothetical protein